MLKNSLIVAFALLAAGVAKAQNIDHLDDSQNPERLVVSAPVASEEQISYELSDYGGENAGCTDCDLACISCAYCPKWIARANAVFLQRVRPDTVILMQDNANPLNNLNARDFDFGFEPGWEVALIRQHESGWGIEGRFLSVDHWTANMATPINAAQVNINTMPIFSVPNVTTINSTYASKLHSFEANLRRELCGSGTLLSGPVTLLGGFRYVEVDERFRALLDGPVLLDTATTNRLYGFQLGAEASVLRFGRLGLDAVLKGGIYSNSSKQNTLITTGAAAIPVSDTADPTAFVGEFALTGTYDINDCLTIRAGYSALWIESVVLATDQVPVSNLVTRTGIDSSGHVVYHGALIGIEFRH